MEWKNNYSKEKYYQVLTKGLLKEECHKRFAEREFFKEKKADLTLSIGQNIKKGYSELSDWEKLFVANFYEQGQIPKGEERYKKVREDIEQELDRLYALADEIEYFKIDIDDNQYLDRYFEGELKALEARGKKQSAEYYRNYESEAKDYIAKQFEEMQQAEYKHIVDFIRSTSYEPAFKAVMLRETLSKVYRTVKNGNEYKKIVENRVLHKTIESHITLNSDVLEVIYNGTKDYSNFANLYFAGLEKSNKRTAEKNTVNIEGLNTFGKGIWLKFEGKKSNKAEYMQNAKKLAALVKNTPWCTSHLASSQLKQGDFYVFVDNGNNPHIAVKMSGNTVDELRGIRKGQELEEEYREIAMEFLKKNKSVRDGKRWLKKEEWNKRLIMWNKKIEESALKQEDVELIMNDIFDKSCEYKSHIQNSNLISLKENLQKVSKMIAIYFNCAEEQIAFGNVSFKAQDRCPYICCLGSVIFKKGGTPDFGNLKYVADDLIFSKNCRRKKKPYHEFRKLECGGYERLPEYLKEDTSENNHNKNYIQDKEKDL
jgi:UTP-glucose-1-phosphate uridylyltransferase